MVQVLNSDEKLQESLELIEEYGVEKDKFLCFTHCVLCHILKLTEKSWKSFKKYLALYAYIDNETIINVINYFEYTQPQSKEELTLRRDYILSNCLFSPIYIENLFHIYFAITFNLSENDYNWKLTLDSIIDKCKEDKHLRVLIVKLLVKAKSYEDAIKFIKPYVDQEIPNEELELYCHSLYESKSHRPELMKIAKFWRKNHKPNFNLLQIEFELHYIQINWQGLAEVSETGLEFFPTSELFIFGYFLGNSEMSNIEAVKKKLYLLKDKAFRNQTYGLRAIGAILRCGFFKEALDLLYNIAKDEKNIEARQEFLTSTLYFPENLFEEYNEVEIGRFVFYSLNDNVEIIQIDESTKDHKIHKVLLNRQVGDTFTIPIPFSDKIEYGKIIRITDKHLALHAEILKEIGDPMKGYQVKPIDFEEDTFEAINKKLIDEFGAKETLLKEKRNEIINGFQTGKLTFSEVVAKAFAKESIDAFYYLTSNKSKCFRVLPASLSSINEINLSSTFILDITSICFFFNLHKDYGHTFDKKFVINSFIKREMVELIRKTKAMPNVEYSISISTEKVTPHFYPKDFKEKRLEFLTDLLRWVEDNCEVVTSEEGLNLFSDTKKESTYDLFFRNLFENWILIGKGNHILLSYDLFYFRHFGLVRNRIINPEVYLRAFHFDRMKEVVLAQLENKFVGVSINSDILFDEYVKFIAGKENKFTICLLNLNYNWNPNLQHIDEAIRFLKKIHLGYFLSLESRRRITINTLYNLMTGMPNQTIDILKNKLRGEFSLLGAHMREAIIAFNIAKKMLFGRG